MAVPLADEHCVEAEVSPSGARPCAASLPGVPRIVGSSKALCGVLDDVWRVASTNATVLVLGETGTGKELIARAVHALSARRDQQFVKLSCGALAVGVVESELFGHERGAFTGAVGRRIGRFELATRGTLFLDEIGEMPLETQVKLLRVLQEREFERVGGTATIRTSARVVAATNRALEHEVAGGRFRADLFYRLHVFPIRIPPLRERREDIPMLVTHFVELSARRLAKPLSDVTPRSLNLLMQHDWPGNIRELQNVIERACIVATGPQVDVSPSLIQPELQPRSSRTGTVSYSPPGLLPLIEVERCHILHVLEATGGRISGSGGAAEILQIHPNTLRSRMLRLGVRVKRAVEDHAAVPTSA